MIVLLGVYTLSNELYLFAVNQFGLAYMLISVGIISVCCKSVWISIYAYICRCLGYGSIYG